MSTITGRKVLVIVAVTLALALVGVGLFGLVRGPRESAASAAGSPPTVHVIAIRPESRAIARMPAKALPHTADPIAYAVAVAQTLFSWDTSSGYLPTDYTAAVLADADPSGEETPGLLSDFGTYVPTTEQWLYLGTMEVAQTLTIAQAYVPASWPVALHQAHGQVRRGTTAVTIDAIRHRTGTWHGHDAASTAPVSFTVFVACPPAFDRCHVLRLSQLDNPLR